MLEVRDLKKYFLLNDGRQNWAVNGVSFHVQDNEILGVVGESGCGKSTLGRLILRLIEPSEGDVHFEGEEITSISRRALVPKRKAMQMVFQNPFASFNPKIRIGGALMEVCRYYGMTASESQFRIGKLLNDTGLSDDLLNRWPRELSGGQLQRLAIARALLSEPSLLIADEPLSALDVSVQAQLLNLLEDLRKKHSMMMIFISHDMTVIEYFCDKVAVMYMGRIMELLPAVKLSQSRHPYTRSLRACAPRLHIFKDSVAPIGAAASVEADDSAETADSGTLGVEERAVPSLGETPDPQKLIKGCLFAPRCPEAKPHCTWALPELREVSTGHWVRCSCS